MATHYDLSGQQATLVPMLLTDNKKTLLSAMIANIQGEKSKLNGLGADVETALNELSDLIEQNTLADGTSVDDLREKLTAVNELLSEEEHGANILAAINLTFTELNRRIESTPYELTCTDENGTIVVDLSALDFASKDDYQLNVSVYGTEPVTASCIKVSETEALVKILDTTKHEFLELEKRLRNCSDSDTGKGPLDVSLTVTHAAKAISKTLTETDGDTNTLG